MKSIYIFLGLMIFFSILSCNNSNEILEQPEEEIIDDIKTWRDLANERIDIHRKSDINIKVVNNSGQVVSNATVEVKLLKHKFKFGAVVNHYFSESPYVATYKETFLKYFNASGFANALKPKQRGENIEVQGEITMQWFQENNIHMRGHTLQWEKASTFRPEMKDVYNDNNLSDQLKAEKLIELSEIHFNHAIEKWDVEDWDVVNENINNFAIDELTPIYTISYWFKLADELRKKYNRPNVKLYLNDYQVISAIMPHALDRPNQYMKILDDLISENTPVEGIGFQSRIKNGYLSPETMYERLVDFEKYNLPYQATEFEIRDSDNYTYSTSEKKQIINEFLTIYFSHPNVDGIWHWTLIDKPDGSSPWALFKYDGTPYPCGEEWMRTMDEDFNTDVSLTTDANGNVSVRGFKGNYSINISYGNQTITENINLNENLSIEIKLTN